LRNSETIKFSILRNAYYSKITENMQNIWWTFSHEIISKNREINLGWKEWTTVRDGMTESWRSLQQTIHTENDLCLRVVTLLLLLPSLPWQQSHCCLETCPSSVCCRSASHSQWSQTTFFCRQRLWSARPGRPPVSALSGAHTSTRTLSYRSIRP